MESKKRAKTEIPERNIKSFCSLRVLTVKKDRQIKLQCLEKVRIWEFGLLVH